MTAPSVVEYASFAATPSTPRLLSLDVFRGLVIFAMLIVNNIGDPSTTGYFWKHADWPAMSWGEAWRAWWEYETGSTRWKQRAELFQEYVQASPSPEKASEFYIINDALNYVRWLSPNEGRREVILQYRSRLSKLSPEFELYRARREELKIAANPTAHIPLFTHCTLADYVMPSFILIIGVAIPFARSAARVKGVSTKWIWLHVVYRSAILVVLGWVLCYFRDQFANSLYGNSPWSFSFGMDVLQLLGLSYLLARVLYELSAKPRAMVALALLIGHWLILGFYPQGDAPNGTFNQHFDAIGYIYDAWRFWDVTTLHIGPLTIGWRGLLSVPPCAATMLIGTLVGDYLRHEDLAPSWKLRRLAFWGAVMVVAGFLWAFDLPFNKPRWTPSYLLYVSGVGTLLIALLYWIIDVKNVRRWTYPFVVFGANAIALYFCSILFKVLFLNTPRIGGKPVIGIVLGSLKGALGAWAGGWTFTVLYIAFWWIVLDQLYRRRIFWKI